VAWLDAGEPGIDGGSGAGCADGGRSARRRRLGFSGWLGAIVGLVLLTMALQGVGALVAAQQVGRAASVLLWLQIAAVVAGSIGLPGVLGMARAVSALRQDAARGWERVVDLEAANHRFDAALNAMAHGLMVVDGDLRLLVVNRRFGEIFALPEAALRPGLGIRRLLELSIAAGNHPFASLAGLEAALRNRLALRVASSNEVPVGRDRVVATTWVPIAGGGWLCQSEDITERHHAQARIIHLARHDTLTDLPNHATFQEMVHRAPAPCAVLCLDLDRFRQVNDTLGHHAGDDVLRIVAQRIRRLLRDGDGAARLGSDEFAIVLANLHQPDDVAALARTLIEAISRPYEIGGQQVVIGATVGIAVATGVPADDEQLVRNADLALCRAKQEGGGYRFFAAEMDIRAQAARTLELDLRNALAQGEFELFYQPLVSVRELRISSFEALLRWRHPQRGLIGPDEFIPLAEQTGLISEIGEWVLHTACREAAGWPASVRVAVNFSSVQFGRADLAAQVEAALSAAGLAAGRLELEITEGVLLSDSAATLETLVRLRALGARISMDDFGTGYSSLSYLNRFPVDKIKIDKSFVSGLAVSEESGAIVRAIAGLGRSLGIATVAEGVETREQVERLIADGLTEMQGYFFSPPRPAADVPRLLAGDAVAATRPAA
jgi:diguanylate cyclase (GGDEF)-like protein